MAAAAQCATPTPQRYQRRRPEQTLWYRILQSHLETWLELASGEDGDAPPALFEQTFSVKKMLDHIGESTRPPRIVPARGPPLGEVPAAAEQAKNDPQWDSSAQSAPEIEFDQCVAW